MLKHIGRSIRVLSLVLAVLCFAGFGAFGALCLFSALEDGVDETLKIAGVQAACISFALAVLTPFLQLITYGLGVLIDTVQAQAQDSKRVREILQASLADGMLSDEIARKSAMAMGKVLPKIQMQAPAAPQGAPVQRPVAQPAIPAVAEEQKKPVEKETAPAEDEIRVEKIEDIKADVPPVPPTKPQAHKPVKPTPAKPLPQNGTWRTLTDDEETF